MSATSERRKAITARADEVAREYQADLAQVGQNYADSRIDKENPQ